MAIAEFFIIYFINYSAPVVGFEPTTISLTGSRSTVELHRNIPILKKKNGKCKKKIKLKLRILRPLPTDRVSLKMTTVLLSFYFYCHPEDFSPKDPSSFSNNWPLIALHGILPCLPAGRANAQNDSWKHHCCGWDSSGFAYPPLVDLQNDKK